MFPRGGALIAPASTETAEDRAADNIPGPLDAARDRRILVQ
jgi:hypothetical protein